ncbi:MAG: Crp/Fnr family transcriptional regulator, partial [Leptospiraceae bacterium]|nr:Crp/Fnr family transcriptional regulator [Leptospiraceae bacterium]
MKLVRENLKAYLTNGGKIPEKVTPKFLTQNHSGFLNKEYNNRPELTNQEFQFLRRIIALKPETLAQVYTADINILIYICEKLSDLNLNAIRELEDCIKEFDSDMDMLLGGSDSLIEKYYMSLDLLNSGISEVPREDFLPLTETISGSINNFLQTYKSLFVSEFKNASPNLITFQELSAKLSKELKSGESPSSTTAGTGSNRSNITIGLDAAAIKKELENSASKILNYAGIEIERVKEYSSLVLKMKSLKNPLDPDPDARKIRRNLTKTYWEAYEKSFLKYLQSNKKVPRPIEMMLKFGYFDETLLEDEQLIFLHQQVEKKDTYRDNLVMTFDGTDWLEKIYRKEFTTSLDELGQTFFDKVKADNRNSQYKKESDLPPDVDNGEARLKYEINSMYISNVRLTTGSPASHLPILTKYHIIYPLEKCIVDSKMLIDTLKAIMAIDYTAFYREVIYNEPDL